MTPLIPCPACARHVYSSEAQCPFCEGALPRPRAVGRGLAAAAGAGLALIATGCPQAREEIPAPAYGAPPPVNVPEAPADADAPPTDADAPPEEPDYRESAPKYGAPPPPRDVPAPEPERDGD